MTHKGREERETRARVDGRPSTRAFCLPANGVALMASATEHRVSAFDKALPEQPHASEDPPDVLTSFRRALCEAERSIDGPYSSTASLRIDGAIVALEGLHEAHDVR